MKLKNLFGMAAMAALVLSSCSSDEVVNDYSPENAIEFGTYVGRGAASRASVITTQELGEQGFGVFAYYTGQDYFGPNEAEPNFMYNEEVKAAKEDWVTEDEGKAGYYSKWTYEPLKYWPNTEGDKISFFAYAPYKTQVNGNITSAPMLDFEIPSDVKAQEDILYATPMLDQTKKKIDEPVVFTFNHALSRIGFQVQTTVDVVNPDTDGTEDDDDEVGNGNLDGATTVIIKNVKLSGNFYNKGQLDHEATMVLENGANKVTEMRVAMEGTQMPEGGETYVLSAGTSADDTNFADPKNITIVGNNSEKYEEWGQNVTTQEATLNKTDDSYIMIIPKKFEGEDKITVEVEYDVVTKDASLPKGYVEIPNTVKTSFTGIEFEAGKAYTFSLHLGLTTVKLTASVDGWDEQNGIDYSVNLPINTTGNDNTNEGVEDGKITPATPAPGGDGGQQDTGGVGNP